ncbi:hypothetical protein D3C77_248460 [compost metagenome]
MYLGVEGIGSAPRECPVQADTKELRGSAEACQGWWFAGLAVKLGRFGKRPNRTTSSNTHCCHPRDVDAAVNPFHFHGCGIRDSRIDPVAVVTLPPHVVMLCTTGSVPGDAHSCYVDALADRIESRKLDVRWRGLDCAGQNAGGRRYDLSAIVDRLKLTGIALDSDDVVLQLVVAKIFVDGQHPIGLGYKLSSLNGVDRFLDWHLRERLRYGHQPPNNGADDPRLCHAFWQDDHQGIAS